MNKTSIVILTYGNFTYNKLCIESIRAFTSEDSYEIIVVDNHSTDGTLEWLREQNDIKRIENADNLGFAKGCNQGILAAESGNDILLLNNDTIVTPHWLQNLQTALHSGDSVGAVGAVTNACSNLQQIPVQYQDFSGLCKFAKAFNRSNPAKWEERVRLIGFCFLIRRKVLNKIGLLDEQFGKGNFEDDDYSMRIRQEGYRLLLCRDCFIHHFGSASFGREGQQYAELLRKNSEKFSKKWGFSPLMLAVDERSVLLPYLREIRSPHAVLVVNSSFGAIPLFLRTLYSKAIFCCVEANPRFAQVSPKGMEISRNVAAFDGRQFDLIVVLTYLRDTEMASILRDLAGKLAVGGILLVHGNTKAGAVVDGLFLDCRKENLGDMLRIVRRRAEPHVSIEKLPQQGQSLSDGPFDKQTVGMLLRRVENHLEEEESKTLLHRLLRTGTVSSGAFKNAVLCEAVEKVDLLSNFGALLYNDGKKDEALDLFIEGYKYKTQNRDLVFNLAYVLAELNKTEDALAVIEQYQNPDQELLKLRDVIKNDISRSTYREKMGASGGQNG